MSIYEIKNRILHILYKNKIYEKNACFCEDLIIIYTLLWGVSSAGLERLPVTQKVEGSSPLHPARDFTAHRGGIFILN